MINRKRTIFRIIILCFFVLIIALILHHKESNYNQYFNYKVYATGNDGWGYNIMIHDRVLIHQDCIPVIEGSKPFSTRRSAKRTARYVIKKLKSKQRPYLTKEDLEKLRIGNN